MKTFTSISQIIGQRGESIATSYLLRNRFRIIDRNFTRKWGELDIIAQKAGKIHFIEVKSVTCEKMPIGVVGADYHRPEEMVHPWKQRKLMRTIEMYLAGHIVKKWQFDVVCVYMNMKTRRARVKILPDIILS